MDDVRRAFGGVNRRRHFGGRDERFAVKCCVCLSWLGTGWVGSGVFLDGRVLGESG